jgi:hypothetical protein
LRLFQNSVSFGKASVICLIILLYSKDFLYSSIKLYPISNYPGGVMKKFIFAIPILILAMTFAHAEGLSESQEQNTVRSVSQMDTAVKTIAVNLNRKLVEVKASKVAIGQFAYRGTEVPLGTYWINQLTGELANTPNKSYAILSAGTSGADWTISGEIIDVANTIRIYTRLIRTENRSVEAGFQSDFERNEQINSMLSSGSSQGGRSSSNVVPDSMEPDSFESPVPYEIGASENAQIVNRTLHSGDEDFFLLIPENDGQLIMETTGSVDTFMEFYNAETRERLAQNDDGGSNYNARIRYSVQAGKRYIAKVKGCESSDTGSYGFRAWISVRTSSSGFENPIPYEIGVDEGATVVNRTLNSDDEDYFLLIPADDGQLIMETTGNVVDTYMEFYNAETRQKLAEDDDGGRSDNARIRYTVQAGKRYIAKVTGYDGDTGQYGFHAWIQIQVRLTPDEYEPNNDSASAKQIEIGKSQQHTFHNSDDVDWVKFQITKPGRYTIRTKGINTNRLDTYIELFDSNLNSIDSDDDGGENLDSKLTLRLENGLYYLKVECLDENPNQPYSISIEEER